MEFRILGPLEVSRDGEPVPLRGGRQRALLALLVVHAGDVVAADRLVAELWPAGPPPTAGKIVQTYVSDLRKALGDGAVATQPPGYRLVAGHEDVDARRFERLVAAGGRSVAAGAPAEAGETLREALALWRGPALAEFAYESFAQAEIGRLEELRLVALEQRLEADLALGRELDVLGELEALVAAHPLRERLRGHLMLALYRAGRQSEALHVFQDARKTLGEELGIEPGPSLAALQQAILEHDPALGAPRGTRTEPPGEGGARLVTLVCAVFDARPDEAGGGDEAARRLLDARDRVVPDEQRRHRGRVLERIAGDAVTAFGTPGDAAAYAVSLRRRLADEQAVSVRMGISLGDASAGEPLGAALGAGRLAERAGAGEILATQAVKNLCAPGAGVRFTARGRLRLPGYGDPWEVFAVAGEDEPEPERPARGLLARLLRRDA